MNLNAALAKLEHTSDNLEHRGLVGTISTDQAHDLTAVNIKRDVLKRPKLLKEQLMLSELNKTFFEAGQRVRRHVKDHGGGVGLDSQRLLVVINNRFSHHRIPLDVEDEFALGLVEDGYISGCQGQTAILSTIEYQRSIE